MHKYILKFRSYYSPEKHGIVCNTYVPDCSCALEYQRVCLASKYHNALVSLVLGRMLLNMVPNLARARSHSRCLLHKLVAKQEEIKYNRKTEFHTRFHVLKDNVKNFRMLTYCNLYENNPRQ